MVSTPSKPQLLGRVAPPRLAPQVFSIRQTAIPAGVLRLLGEINQRRRDLRVMMVTLRRRRAAGRRASSVPASSSPSRLTPITWRRRYASCPPLRT